MTKTVVIFGSTGAIGTEMIQIVSKNQPDWTIRAVSRSGAQSKARLATLKLPNVEMVKGEVEDLDSAKEVTKDADMVYCCVGFPRYERKYWAEHWPIVIDNLLTVTSASKPLVFCDNLYAYGPTTNITTKSPIIPASNESKPAVRALIRQKLQKRMNESPESIVAVAGADFFGPHVGDDKSVLGGIIIGKMVKGQKPMTLASCKVIHDFCYARDFGNALYLVSTDENRPKSMGRFWICPHTIRNMSFEDIASEVNNHLDNKVEGFQELPSWLFYILGVFMTTLYELREMMPFWRNDYTVDPSEFEEAFGVKATPLDQALTETMDSLKQG